MPRLIYRLARSAGRVLDLVAVVSAPATAPALVVASGVVALLAPGGDGAVLDAAVPALGYVDVFGAHVEEKKKKKKEKGIGV